MKTWLEQEFARVSAKSALAYAIRYAPRHWKGLGLFFGHSRVEIDSNTVERTIRPIKLGTKNHLFAGSDGDAKSWAVIGLLIQTAKLNGVEFFAYLRDVLERIVLGRTKANELSSLLLWTWKASQTQAVVNSWRPCGSRGSPIKLHSIAPRDEQHAPRVANGDSVGETPVRSRMRWKPSGRT
jgi:hypothetical protein